MEHIDRFRKQAALLVKEYTGPVYIYDLQSIENRFLEMKNVLQGVEIYFAMKSNSNLQVLKLLKSLGSRIDIVSLGELERALEAGFHPADMVFSGVGKTEKEINFALDRQIHQINVESLPELQRIIKLAKQKNARPAIALRLNPNVDIQTHPYIATGLHENKFGIEISQLAQILDMIDSEQAHLNFVGLSLHLGSQMWDLEGFRQALQLLKPVYEELQNRFPSVTRFDVGGGLGIDYEKTSFERESQLLRSYFQVIQDELKGLKTQLQTEPGRWIVAHGGILLTQIQYCKVTPYKKFLILDAGMNHLLRPALYQAHHQIFKLVSLGSEDGQVLEKYDIVGPICESADFFAKDRQLAKSEADEFLLIADTGAYGFTMANVYNLQELPREVCFS